MDIEELIAAKARRDDPGTSKAAARKAQRHAGTLVVRVLRMLDTHGPQTSEEASNRLGIALGSITPRFAPMRRQGLIERLDDTREGASHSPRYVEAITDKGRAYLAALDESLSVGDT